MTIYVKDGGTWQRIKSVHNNVSGTWERADQGVSINNSGTWRTVYAEGSQEYTSSTSTTFTIPEGVHFIKVTAAGAGGGGGGGYYTVAGQGGGGGAYVNGTTVEVNSGDSLTISVGAGGAGDVLDYPSSSTDGYGTNGGATTISGSGLSITLNGGNGGSGGYEYATQGNQQGAGGTGSGISGATTGQTGGHSTSYGYGGYSVNGAISGGFGTNNGYHGSSCWIGLYGDDSGMSGYGTGGGGRPDCGPDGLGGNGADGYLKIEWGNEV